MIRVTAALALLGIIIALSACNTVSGVGQDIKKAGNAIERTADKYSK